MVNEADWSAIASRVRSETFVRHIERHEEIGSTNDRAMVLAAERDLPIPALVLTERQTAGRGRSANVWRSGPGALTFSVIVERPPGVPAARTPIVSLLAGLAARRAIAGCVPDAVAVKVKWPNDVYLAGRKVCGILTEVPSSSPHRIIIGIGINGNNSLSDAPDDVRRRAVSIREATGTNVDLGELLVATLIGLEEELAAFGITGEISIDSWSPHCLLTGRDIRLRLPNGDVCGVCTGVASTGSLRLETKEGPSEYKFGEVIGFD